MSAEKSHKWDVGGSAQRMRIEEEADATTMRSVIDVSEAERLIERLAKFSVEEVGGSRWMQQHQTIATLNLQAHQCALTKCDEFVVEAVLTFSKLDTIIHDLLIIEVWKEHVLPHLIERLSVANSMRAYFVFYHEATLVNLLEVLFFHAHVCEAAGEKLIEVVDYLGRKLTKLNGGYDFRSLELVDKSPSEMSTALAAKTPLEELRAHLAQIEFKVCIAACSLVRFLCEHADKLPLSVCSRITDTHDLLVLVIPLIENPPWTRRSGGKWQKLVDQKWTDVAPIDLLRVTKLEGQPWLSLYFLLAKTVFRERYHINAFRKSQLLRVRKYINEVLLDQLPFLADIQVRLR